MKEIKNRFITEFWVIATMVGFGFIFSYRFGFYYFRMIDIVFIMSMVYFVRLIIQNRIEKRVKSIIYFSLIYIILRFIYDFNNVSNIQSIRTLFSLSITFLTPIIYFVVRESAFDNKKVKIILAISVVISILSQFGLLRIGESEVSGAVDLARLFGIKVPVQKFSMLEFQERTITIWRALSVGLTFSLLFIKTNFWIKILALAGLFLQTAGGGGGRGGLVFVVLTPVIIFTFWNSDKSSKLFNRLIIGGIISAVFASVYLWAPFGDKLLAKSNYSQTHYERAVEIFTLFTEGWQGSTYVGGFNARTFGYEEYITRIFLSPSIFSFGVGHTVGAAFDYTANQQAHNMFLDIWARSGIIGLSIFLFALYHILADLRRLLRIVPKSTSDKVILLSVAIAVIYFLQPLFFQAVTSDRSFMIVFFLLSGLMKPLSNYLTVKYQLISDSKKQITKNHPNELQNLL